MSSKKKNSLKIKKITALVFALLVTIFVLVFRKNLTSLGTFGYLGVFLVSIIGNATIILPIPSILAAYLGGGLLNPLLVGILAAFGATIGELTGYLAGYGGRDIVKDQEKLKRIEGWMKKHGLWTIFVLAIIPNPLFDLAGIASGVLHLPVWKFFIATFLGKTIKFLGFSYLGAGSFKLFEKLF